MQLHLKQLEHPYLHELFKAVLLYDAPKIKLHLGEYTEGGLTRSFDKDFKTDVLIKRGGVRLLPLDWLLPILEERMGEFLK